MNGIRVTAIAFVGALVSTDAFAYVDPGTGSLLIQWLFGAVVAGFAVLNIYWHKAKQFLSRKSMNTGPVGSADEATAADESGRD